MDGVLILSEALTAKAAVLALLEYGIACREEDFLPFVGTGEQGYLGGVCSLYGKAYEPSMADALYRAYGTLVSPAQKPIGLDRVLDTLKEKDYQMAVCSSANDRKVSYNLRAIEREKSFFDAVISGSCVKRNKPDPEVFLLGAEKLGCKSADCIVVEDAVSGIRAAKAGGFSSIAVCSTLANEQILSACKPDYIVEKLEDILKIL